MNHATSLLTIHFLFSLIFRACVLSGFITYGSSHSSLQYNMGSQSHGPNLHAGTTNIWSISWPSYSLFCFCLWWYFVFGFPLRICSDKEHVLWHKKISRGCCGVKCYSYQNEIVWRMRGLRHLQPFADNGIESKSVLDNLSVLTQSWINTAWGFLCFAAFLFTCS